MEKFNCILEEICLKVLNTLNNNWRKFKVADNNWSVLPKTIYVKNSQFWVTLPSSNSEPLLHGNTRCAREMPLKSISMSEVYAVLQNHPMSAWSIPLFVQKQPMSARASDGWLIDFLSKNNQCQLVLVMGD